MAEEKTIVKEKKTEPKAKNALLAVVLVRGLIGIRFDVRDTLMMLRLRRKHTCVILDDSVTHRGMLKKVKDFVAYGPVEQSTVDELKKARKQLNEKPLVFSMAPPRGGFERKGIKKSHAQGGVLAYRKEMDTLLKKMM